MATCATSRFVADPPDGNTDGHGPDNTRLPSRLHWRSAHVRSTQIPLQLLCSLTCMLSVVGSLQACRTLSSVWRGYFRPQIHYHSQN